MRTSIISAIKAALKWLWHLPGSLTFGWIDVYQIAVIIFAFALAFIINKYLFPLLAGYIRAHFFKPKAAEPSVVPEETNP